MDLLHPELWILVSIAAAAFQTVRFMLQKVLATATLSAAGATFSRFVYSAPFILALLAIYFAASGTAMPGTSPAFWVYAVLGGTAQILATVCVVLLFKQRNFAVGITFKKTEVIQTALMGWIVLGEGVKPLGLVAILLGVFGLLLLSGGPETKGLRLSDLRKPAAVLGIASGVLFAVSAVSYRGASLSLEGGEAALRAGVTLGAVVCLQTLIMAVWLVLREPGQIRAVWSARRVAFWIGMTSMAGSYCWFYAFTLQNAAYVKAVGQIELILSIAAATLFFHERITRRELAGIALLLVSILMLVLVL